MAIEDARLVAVGGDPHGALAVFPNRFDLIAGQAVAGGVSDSNAVPTDGLIVDSHASCRADPKPSVVSSGQCRDFIRRQPRERNDAIRLPRRETVESSARADPDRAIG